MNRQQPKTSVPPAIQTAPSPWHLRTKTPVLWFGLNFGFLMGLYYVLILLPFFDRLLYSYLSANASATGVVLNLLGANTQVSEVTVRSAEFVMSVRRGCDALEPTWFFCAAVISFPAPWSRKVPGLVLGSALILVLNLVRLVSLFLIGLHYPRLFSVFHLEIWPAGFILLAVLLFLAWIGWTLRSTRIPANAPS